jgi:phage terminase small subunit
MPARKKPTSLRVLNGSLGVLHNFEAKPQATIVCPDWLSYGAKKVWDDIAPMLEAGGIISDHDAMALGAYCELFSEFKECPQEFPSSKMTQLRLLMADFGLTPASRSGLKETPKTDKNKFAGNGKKN